MNEPTAARLLPVPVACASLGIGKTKFYEELDAGRIRSVVVGKRRMVAPADLDSYVDLLRAEAAAVEGAHTKAS